MTYEEMYQTILKNDMKKFTSYRFKLYACLHDKDDRPYTNEFFDECYDLFDYVTSWIKDWYDEEDFVERLYEICDGNFDNLDFKTLRENADENF